MSRQPTKAAAWWCHDLHTAAVLAAEDGDTPAHTAWHAAWQAAWTEAQSPGSVEAAEHAGVALDAAARTYPRYDPGYRPPTEGA